MISKIFSIYDEAAAAHLPPFFLPTDAMAKRTFGDCINDPKHAFSAHPDHYTLFDHGTFDNLTGEILSNENMLSLGNGVIFKSTEMQLEFSELAQVTDAIPQVIRK